jgi:hypothetical protein
MTIEEKIRQIMLSEELSAAENSIDCTLSSRRKRSKSR